MSPSPFQRCVALSIAAVITWATLGALDLLAQPEATAPQWAQKSSHHG
jgi:hypothetical protein